MGKMISISNGHSVNIPAYLAEPEGDFYGGIILIHEIWGLADHIKDVAERFAKQGYLVLAPNLFADSDLEEHLTPELGKQLFNPETRNAVQPILREITAPTQTPEFGRETVTKLQECFDYLYSIPTTNQKVAVLGYCFGGTYSFNLAAVEPRLKAAVPYYGYFALGDIEEVKAIKCPVLALYGENDERLMEQLPEVEDKMKQAGVNFTSKVYENCGHAFFNDTNPYAYNREAAESAWQLTLDFLKNNLA